ncbi:DUF4260 domain-containing protein [Streptomyces sp. NBC_01754]|uniref:DUF4260 family protein n=1 Tax=Streptomyces sp. NBC_01754 TaxID=2975930 RepID=UPI002DDA7C93|nr:DUF4260 family protein [Streptomyces sp. NBC_01754]WSC95527.1 DUF4260 domain-containing protein [Streptomyces sp. NBC_01754]
MTHSTAEGATRSSASRPVRAAWGLLGAFLLVWVVFEAVKHGGWVIPLAVLGLVVPDLSFFAGASGEHRPGQLPRGTVAVYNLVHRPLVPLVLMVPPAALADGPGDNAAPFTFGLAWLTHIALDRAMGYGLRTADGWQR